MTRFPDKFPQVLIATLILSPPRWQSRQKNADIQPPSQTWSARFLDGVMDNLSENTKAMMQAFTGGEACNKASFMQCAAFQLLGPDYGTLADKRAFLRAQKPSSIDTTYVQLAQDASGQTVHTSG